MSDVRIDCPFCLHGMTIDLEQFRSSPELTVRCDNCSTSVDFGWLKSAQLPSDVERLRKAA
jgi:hypothetical protein